MSRCLLFTLLFPFNFCSFAQLSTLHADYDESVSSVFLYWNMMNNSGKTTYVLLRSKDKKNWTEIVTDKVPREYTSRDTFDYADKIKFGERYFYRLKIINQKKEQIALSDIVVVNEQVSEKQSQKNTWKIYPNPVANILHIVCEGTEKINGVINALITDVTGKIVVRFRSASIYRTLEIPVTQLRKGIYAVQVSILNEVVMKQEFLKQ